MNLPIDPLRSLLLQADPGGPSAKPAPAAAEGVQVVPVSPEGLPELVSDPGALQPDAAEALAVPEMAAWEVWLSWGVVPAAALLLGLLWWSGRLSRERLRLAPNRRVGLTGWDALIGLWLWACGMVMAGGAMGALAALRGVAPTAVQDDPASVVVMQLLMFGPPVVWLLWRVRARSGKRAAIRRLGLLPARPGRIAKWTLLALPAALLLSMGTQVFSAAVATLLGHPPPMIQHDLLNQYTAMRDEQQWLAMAVLTFSTVVVAPICEELFNRGLLQTSLLAWWGPRHRWWVIGAVSVFFSLLHLGAVPLVALPALLLLGLVFGFLYERTGSLWPPMLVHAGFNALNVLYVLAAA